MPEVGAAAGRPLAATRLPANGRDTSHPRSECLRRGCGKRRRNAGTERHPSAWLSGSKLTSLLLLSARPPLVLTERLGVGDRTLLASDNAGDAGSLPAARDDGDALASEDMERCVVAAPRVCARCACVCVARTGTSVPKLFVANFPIFMLPRVMPPAIGRCPARLRASWRRPAKKRTKTKAPRAKKREVQADGKGGRIALRRAVVLQWSSPP